VNYSKRGTLCTAAKTLGKGEKAWGVWQSVKPVTREKNMSRGITKKTKKLKRGEKLNMPPTPPKTTPTRNNTNTPTQLV